MNLRSALVLLVSLNALSPVAAASGAGDLPEARMSWRLSFGDGGQPLQTGYGLTVGYRGLDGTPAEQLLQLDVSDTVALARLAGLPLFQRDYRAQQNDGGTAFAASGPSPWFARKWVWWTAGSLAATAALAGGGGSGGETTLCTGVCNQNNTSGSGTGTSINGSGPDGFVCVDGTCAVPCDADNRPAGCVGLADRVATVRYAIDPETLRWLDAGTGHMGDLIAR